MFLKYLISLFHSLYVAPGYSLPPHVCDVLFLPLLELSVIQGVSVLCITNSTVVALSVMSSSPRHLISSRQVINKKCNSYFNIASLRGRSSVRDMNPLLPYDL